MTRRPLGRDVVLALVLKLAALSLIYLLFFRGDGRPVIDADRAARHLLGPQFVPAPLENTR